MRHEVFQGYASELGQGMDPARRTQDAPPQPVCGLWTGALDGLRGYRARGRQAAASRLRRAEFSFAP